MSEPLPISVETLRPDELERLRPTLDRLAWERKVKARYAQLLRRYRWDAAITLVAEEEHRSFRTIERVIHGG